jgi:acetyltransferase-like isoleucine patch superfamily enzyme
MVKSLFVRMKRLIKFELNKKEWREKNKHNFTVAKNIFPIKKITVGKYTYGPLNIISYGNPQEKLTIGNYCSIAEDVKFLLGGEHHPEFLMNYPFKLYLQPGNDMDDRRSKGPINIKDDVWIGTNVVILSGVTIGQGAIIAAGSVVTKDVPPYAIYTTNKIIKYRFSQKIIQQLLKIDFSKLDPQQVKQNIDMFYTSEIHTILQNSNIEHLRKI